MSIALAEIHYPESDGEPMADNTRQAEWMLRLWGNLDALLPCFVGTNNFWYPVEGEPEVRLAPDVYVAFDRPKGHRGSYQQWKENDVPVTVVFEIWSPGNTRDDRELKHTFYEEHGVEEYYLYDPYRNYLEVYRRQGTVFRRVWNEDGYRSPRMGIVFDLSSGPELVVRYPDGRPFLSLTEMEDLRTRAVAEAQRAIAARDQAETRADQAESRADQAESRADQAESRADQAEVRLNRVIELSRKARRGLATAEELAELDRLEG